ncbi:glycosyltransferase [Paenibacillus sp. YYML68]|uniref:glycosyltransferase family protein n=1 Tax=Paenibacillus sp. YYML68 TaxID=2909250 RepID=UPI002492AA66|nr:glycosyltransferase [Paenibacillus sp. YYML68]
MSRTHSSGAAAGREAGWDEGYDTGWEHGRHYGRCEAVRQRVSVPAPSVRRLKVLFVPQGFDGLDQGLEAALRRTVATTIIAHATEMFTKAAEHRPDLVLVMNGLHIFPADHLEQVDRIRSELGIKTAIWFADDPYFTDHTVTIAPHYDCIVTHEMSCVPFYASLGCKQVHYLPLAVDTDRFRPQPAAMSYRSDICFIGNAFWNRVEWFDRLAPYLAGKRVFIGGGHWDRMTSYKLLKPYIRDGWIPVEETVRYYSGAKIVINMHRGHDHQTDNRNQRHIPPFSINPRTYEISACGTLQLTDVRSDLTRYYTPGVELDVYHSPEDLIAKLDYYLKHEEARQRIALNGLKRTLQEHTFVHRVDQLFTLLGYSG